MKVKNGVFLVTLWDKTGMEERCRRLADLNIGIIASKGTAEQLNRAGIEAYDVANLSGQGPSSGHLVVTISEPMALALITATEEERRDLKRRRIPDICGVFAGLYPLEEKIENPDLYPDKTMRDMTDVGGRVDAIEAVKGLKPVAYSLDDMDEVLDWLEKGKPDPEQFLARNKARAELRIVEYTLASALYSDPTLDLTYLREMCSKSP